MNTTETLIQKYYGAFNKGDMNTFFSLLDENIVHDINQGPSEQGMARFKAFMDSMHSHYEEQVEDLTVMVSHDGTRAAAEFMIVGKYIKTQKGLLEAKGQKYSISVGAFFEIQKEKIKRVTNYYNMQNWIAQVEA